jgi:hypothetical protein
MEGSAPDQYVSESIFSDVSYVINAEAMTAEADLMVRIVHEDGRTPIVISEKLAVRVSDEGHTSVPELGLPINPIILPDNEIMVQELHRQALMRTQTALNQSFDQWRHELLIQARGAETEERRVEYYVAYILTDPANRKPSYQESIDGLLGIFDATRLLRSAP